MDQKFPLPTGILFYLIVFLFVGALPFLWFTHMEQSIHAQGVVALTGEASVVDVPVKGRIQTIHANHMDTVDRGATLFSISEDATSQTVSVEALQEGIVFWHREFFRGEYVSEGERLAVIRASEPIGIIAIPMSSDIGRIQPDMTVRIRLEAYPYQEYGTLTGRVKEFVHPLGDPTTIHVHIAIEQIPQDMTLIPGMVASVEMITGRIRLVRMLF